MALDGVGAGASVGSVNVITENNPPIPPNQARALEDMPADADWDPMDHFDDPDMQALIPDPETFYAVVALPEKKDKIGSIFVPESHQDVEQAACMMGLVLKMGPNAFNDPTRYPSGSKVKPGVWVMMSMYAGTRFTMGGQEFRLISDDCVKGTVVDPLVIGRV